MKFLSLFAIFLALAVCDGAEIAEPLAAQSRSIGSMIVDTLEELKVQLEVGIPKYGIPPCAPLKIAHKDFNFETGEFRAVGEVDSLEVYGINEFEILIMDVNAFLSRIKYEFVFHSLNVTTQYKADVGAGYHVAREGGAFLALEELRVYGQISYSTGILPGSSLRVKSINVNIEAGNVVSNIENLSKYRIMNRKLNEIVEEFISLTINENTDLVATYIDNTLTPICNDLIGDRTLNDLLGLIGGGSF